MTNIKWPVLLLGLSLLFSCSEGNHDNGIRSRGLKGLTITDIFGRSIQSTTLRGNIVYLEFLSQCPPSHLQLIDTIFREHAEHRGFVAILFFHEECSYFRRFEKANNIYFVLDRQNEYRLKLDAPLCCDSFLIFNETGALYAKGANNLSFEKDVKPYLLGLDAQRRSGGLDSPGSVVPDMGRISGALSQEIDLFKGQYKYYVIGLFSEICTACPSGAAVRKIEGLASLNRGTVSYVLCVPHEFSDVDIANLIGAMRLTIPVKRVSKSVAREWEHLKAAVPASDFMSLFLIFNSRNECIRIAGQKDFGVFVKDLEAITNEAPL